MNRTFKSYYKEAYLASKKSFKKKDNLIKYYSYFIPTLILRLVLFIFYPLFRVEDHRLGRQIRSNEEINLGNIYAPGDDSKNLWTSLHLNLVLLLTFIGKIIAIALPFGIYFYFMYYIFTFYIHIQYFVSTVIIYLPVCIGAVILLITIIKYLITCLVTPFIIEATDTKRVSDVVNKAKELKERGGMGLVIKNLIVTTLIQLLIVGLLLSVSVGLLGIRGLFPQAAFYPIYFAMCLLASLILLRVSPVFTMTRRIVNEMIFEDLYITNSRTDNIKVETKVKKAFNDKMEKQDIKENILKLFDEQVELEKFIEPKKETKHEDIEVLKKNDDAKDFFEDVQITNEESATSTIKAQRNSFQEVAIDESKSVTEETLSSIDDLLKTSDNRNPEEGIEESIIEPVIEEFKATEPITPSIKEEMKADDFFAEEVKEEPVKKTRKIKAKVEEVKVDPVIEEIKEETTKAEEVNEQVIEEPKIEKPKRTRKTTKKEEQE